MFKKLTIIAICCVGICAFFGVTAKAQDGWNINWAFNLNPGTPDSPIAPYPFESDHGWGGGAQPQEIIDGFRGCNGPGGFACGLAFTGGDSSWGGEACGIRQATISLGDARVQVSAVRITHHSDQHVPKIYQIQTWDGSNWITQVSITDNNRGRCARAPSYEPSSDWTCMITDEFQPVQTTKVRYTLNNCPDQNTSIIPGQTLVHGWLWEFEVYRLP